MLIAFICFYIKTYSFLRALSSSVQLTTHILQLNLLQTRVLSQNIWTKTYFKNLCKSTPILAKTPTNQFKIFIKHVHQRFLLNLCQNRSYVFSTVKHY